MAISKFSVLLLVLAFVLGMANGKGLKVGFYKKTCPNVETIVKKTMDNVMAVSPSLGGPLLRMHFHDCFVRVCASLYYTHMHARTYMNISLSFF